MDCDWRERERQAKKLKLTINPFEGSSASSTTANSAQEELVSFQSMLDAEQQP
jgi:hypothetical protein